MDKGSLQSPRFALLLKPGFELDVFIYRYIFDGILETIETPVGRQLERPIPSFSRKADAAKTLLIRMTMENLGLPFQITFGDKFEEAKAAGYITGDSHFKVWEFSAAGMSGYGRTLEEAICKLAITMKMREDGV